MRIGELLFELQTDGVIRIGADDLDALVDRADRVCETATGIAGTIRTLRIDGRTLVQERDPDHNHYLRELPSEEAAARFVDARLASYERMWDG